MASEVSVPVPPRFQCTGDAEDGHALFDVPGAQVSVTFDSLSASKILVCGDCLISRAGCDRSLRFSRSFLCSSPDNLLHGADLIVCAVVAVLDLV